MTYIVIAADQFHLNGCDSRRIELRAILDRLGSEQGDELLERQVHIMPQSSFGKRCKRYNMKEITNDISQFTSHACLQSYALVYRHSNFFPRQHVDDDSLANFAQRGHR